jgi:hypothetical protein
MAEESPEQQQEQERAKQTAQDRINQLNGRIKELEKLVNMDNRLRGVEETANNASQAAVQALQQGQAKNEPLDPWEEFGEQKFGKVMQRKINEATMPLRNAGLQLVDKIDYLQTMLNHDDYKDPEFQQEVETIRQRRLRETGQLEARENIIFALRGRDPEKYGKGRKKAKETDEEDNLRQPVHVESGAPAASRSMAPEKKLDDMTTEELAKFIGNQPI